MLILASNSSARRQLLENAGVRFEAVAADVDEAALRGRWPGLGAEEVAMRLAEAKALAVSERATGALVLGSDSVAELEPGHLLEKPMTEDGLRRQLQQLRDRWHRLVSAVAFAQDGRLLWRHAEAARLRMRAFSDGFLARYVDQAGAGVRQSVGGYHVEGLGAQLFEAVEGSEFVVRGLPLFAVLSFLREAGELPQ